MPKLKRAGVGLALPGEDAEQRGLARAVEAHDQEAVLALDSERHVAKDERAAVSLGEARAMKDDAAAARRLGKADLHLALAAWRHDARRLHPLDAGEDRPRLLGALLRLAPHHLGEEAQALDLGLLAVRQRRHALLLEPPRGLVLRVGAAVLDEPAGVEVEHARDRRVEQPEVVADDDDGAAVVA